MTYRRTTCCTLLAIVLANSVRLLVAAEQGLVGHWKLDGDSQDSSGAEHRALNHHVNLETGEFNGRNAYLEIPAADNLNFGTGDFSISLLINSDKNLTDIVGDLVTKFDATHRKGWNLTVNASNPGYNSTSNVRHLFFGVDNDTAGEWTDCGRPNPKTHISDALTVFNGDLYAGSTDARDEADWAHVYRYRGGKVWEDLGRLGGGKTRGVYAMVVHDGALYAATSASHGGQPATMDFGRVYRYAGDKKWEDIGQPGKNFRLNSLASFGGKLYVAGFNIGPEPGHVYVYEGDKNWRECGEFNGWPHALAVHDGRLFAAYPQGEVYAFDGNSWENLGNPHGTFSECNQIHSMGVHRGELHVGSWPKGKVAVWRNSKWHDLGQLGDSTEVIGLTVYNGSLYAGAIPRAEVFRFDGDHRWTSLRRLFDPPNFAPVGVGSGAKAVEDWSRASSLAVFNGKLFVTTATCYRTYVEAPRPDEIRGKVYSLKVGEGVGYDRALGPGWKHIVAVRAGNSLKLYIDGRLAASQKNAKPLDISSEAPLQIGFGPQSHFAGQLRDIRLYNRALSIDEVQSLNSHRPTAIQAARAK
jgi:hypothetical protein